MFARATTAFALLIATPSFGWEHAKGELFATATERSGNYVVSFSCTRGRNQLNFRIDSTQPPDTGLQRPRQLMIGLTLPDGRSDRWSLLAVPEGDGLSGTVLVSSFNLDFFGNGQQMRIADSQKGEVIFTSDMKGTGAARIAFNERCGL